MEIINRIQFQEKPKISVGRVIRQVVCYLYNEMTRTLNEYHLFI
jgi:hypothetical protein